MSQHGIEELSTRTSGLVTGLCADDVRETISSPTQVVALDGSRSLYITAKAVVLVVDGAVTSAHRTPHAPSLAEQARQVVAA